MTEDRTIRVRLQAEVASYMQGMRTAAGATTDFGRQVSGMGSATNANMEKVGRSALLMAGGMTLAMGAAAKSAIDWEASWVGVLKTVEGSESQLSSLEDGLRGMAKELPATHGEIAAVDRTSTRLNSSH